MAWAIEPSDPPGLVSMRLRGGTDAPSRARRSVLSLLEGDIEQATASDVGLLVSELVTNSVRHAGVGPRRTLTVELMTFHDRLRISVTDPGSRLEPRILAPDHDRVGGVGLLLVSQLSEAWGVARDGTKSTRVWCDIPLHRAPGGVPAVARHAAQCLRAR
jgi:anti-sigma regulatory factor (Ser/Thr protein kinase)